MITLDLMDERNLYAADLDCDEHEGEPSEDNPLPVVWPTVWQVRRGKWACVLSEAEIVRLVVGCRHALKLPLGDKMRMGLQDTLEQAEEAKRRIPQPRPLSGSQHAPWQEIDLLREVRVVAGATGRQVGKEWVFRCPLGRHEDRHPSFQVNPETKQWWCTCGSGGVVAWRKAVESRRHT